MNCKNICLQTVTIKEALKNLDDIINKILIITDEDNKLVGTITDGDIRRWILKNGDFNESIAKIMNSSPIFLLEDNRSLAADIMSDKKITAIPIVNKRHHIMEIVFLNDKIQNNKFQKKQKLEAMVVINAGGMGSRLQPLTNIIPKPLIPIGDTSIIERIMNKFYAYQCNEFTIVINYKKELIKAYFKELIMPYSVCFIEEAKPLGTIGALSTLKGCIKEPIFLSNCDIIIEGDYIDMLEVHKKSKNKITIITSLKHNQLPYGVIKLDKSGSVYQIEEKPQFDYLVNTGLYIIEPDIIEQIPKDKFYHATDLINICISENKKVGIYPVSEDCWLDMGEFNEMTKMYEKLKI